MPSRLSPEKCGSALTGLPDDPESLSFPFPLFSCSPQPFLPLYKLSVCPSPIVMLSGIPHVLTCNSSSGDLLGRFFCGLFMYFILMCIILYKSAFANVAGHSHCMGELGAFLCYFVLL